MELLGTPIWAWGAFFSIVVALLAFDLGILHKRDREIGVHESLWLSAGYIAVACLFGVCVGWTLGHEQSIEFFTGYFIEKSLSLDNIFVISLIFTAFSIPRLYQHRVLFWGILGVIVLRGLMIGIGAALIAQFHWILYVFGGFLVVTGIRMLCQKEHDKPIESHPLVVFLQRHIRVTKNLHGHDFVAREPDTKTGRVVWHATPLLLALILVECADVVFAVDSVPAVFAITQDPFIVYTSNIFAILGLRALYFALAAVIHRFAYLKYALAAVLVFIGGKIFYAELVEKVPALLSLGVTFGLLAAGVLVSMLKTRAKPA
ncbi:MAG: TerC family protein [Parvibaculum sp.]|uniref:TerC family protein n=1 Tax=Parvibaculum sp. TaxID=2024848 RepID=UPI0025D59847|nr:TerC family protein [Parvibaculum sp.]MCE9648664.1 TerC family protein [Parvibaculum sp.]